MTINYKQYLYSVLACTVRVKQTALSDPAAQDSQFIRVCAMFANFNVYYRMKCFIFISKKRKRKV